MEGFDELNEGEKWSLAKNFYMLIHASVVSASHLCYKDRHQTGARIKFFFWYQWRWTCLFLVEYFIEFFMLFLFPRMLQSTHIIQIFYKCFKLPPNRVFFIAYFTATSVFWSHNLFNHLYSPQRILYILLDTLPDRVFTNGITLGLKNSIHINYT